MPFQKANKDSYKEKEVFYKYKLLITSTTFLNI